MERDDLQHVSVNNATWAFSQTGLFPYNLFSETWSNTVETIGCAQQKDAGAHYKPFANLDTPKLCESDSIKLHKDMEDHRLNCQDIEIAYIQANQILSRWREEIQKAVSEGENYNMYSHMLLASPWTDSEKWQ